MRISSGKTSIQFNTAAGSDSLPNVNLSGLASAVGKRTYRME